MVTHVIYHSPCYDGFGAAWAAWKKYPDAIFIPASHGEPAPELPQDAEVAIVDFSYPRPTMERMQKSVRTWVCLDHHKTAQEACEGLKGCIFDLNHSGAYLSWKYFHPSEEVPRLIQYLEDRDLWRYALPKSRAISAWIQSWDYDFEAWSALATLLHHNFEDTASEGSAILRAKEQMIIQMADNFVWRDIGGYRVPVANATCYFSEVAELLRLNHPEAKFGAYYMDRADGKRQWGMRSAKDFDVSEVAKSKGGGGHPDAAGFTEPIA